MLLREFISTTLADIINGIADAQSAAIPSGAIIAPESDSLSGTAGKDFVSLGGDPYP